MSESPVDVERMIIAQNLRIYTTPSEQAAVRGGMSDAAHLLDSIAKEIIDRHRVRGRVTKKGNEIAMAFAIAANQIWAMREKTVVAPPPPITPKD